MPAPMTALIAVMSVFAAAAAELTPDGLARYQQANAAVSAGQWRTAIETYNALAAEFPRVAEVFAGRCSALVGQQNFPAAEADCTYALKVKPSLAAARYALAMALDYQGKRDAAVAQYKEYAALDEKQAPYRAAATARIEALAGAPTAKTPPPPPPPPSGGVTAPPMVAAADQQQPVAQPVAAGGAGKLVVYRNHVASVGRLMLVLDGKLVGDISMDEYVEIDTAAGEHLLEARTYPATAYDQPRTWNRPFRVGPAPVYANFDTRGGQMVLQEVPPGQAQTEIRSDCKKAFSRTIGPDSAMAPPPQQAVVVAPGYVAPYPYPGRGVIVVAPGNSGARACRFSSDCGNSSDYSCRSWRGSQVCMGLGYAGAPCWFSSDCLSDSCDGSAKVCR